MKFEEQVRYLRELYRVASPPLVVNDLTRVEVHSLVRLSLPSTCLAGTCLIHHDGPLSLGQSFGPAELLALARRAGWKTARVSRQRVLPRLPPTSSGRRHEGSRRGTRDEECGCGGSPSPGRSSGSAPGRYSLRAPSPRDHAKTWTLYHVVTGPRPGAGGNTRGIPARFLRAESSQIEGTIRIRPSASMRHRRPGHGRQAPAMHHQEQPGEVSRDSNH